jgi:hypothetical protein
MSPILETDPGGGQVVVTRFECGTLRALLAIRLLHVRLKHDVRRNAAGFVGVKTLADWRGRTLLSVSLWKDLDSVYTMGMVRRHVSAVRLPGRLGVRTTCGVFCFVGDWRRVMFQSPMQARSPLYPLLSQPPLTHVRREEGSHGHTDRSRLRRDRQQRGWHDDGTGVCRR